LRRLALPLLVLLALLLLWWLGSDAQESAHDGGVGSIQREDAAPEAPPPVRVSSSDEEDPAPRLAGTGAPPPPVADAPEGTLRCLVLGPDGKPRPRSVVLLEIRLVEDVPSPSPLPAGFEHVKQTIRYADIGRAQTDVSGYATFPDLPACVFRVSAPSLAGLIAPSATVEIEDGEHEVVLSYRAGVNARVTVVDPEGRPVAGAIVHVRGVDAAARTDDEGTALLEGLDPDRDAKLLVQPPLGADVLATEVDPWPVRDTRVVLQLGLCVSGRVVDDRGDPVPHANVHRNTKGASWTQTKAGRDGSFRFRGLRPGDVLTLEVGPPGDYAAAVTEPVVAEAGTEDLVFVLPRGGVLDIVVRDWPSGGKGGLRLTSTRDTRALRMFDIGKSGRVEIRYLDPEEEYVLWGTVRGDERFLYLPSVRAQEEQLALDLQEGESIEVEVDVPDGVNVRSVRAYGTGVYRHAAFTIERHRKYRIPALPAGRWTVQVLGTQRTGGKRRSWTAETVARPGETVHLTLEPEEPEGD
jgi:hypothetical protein